VTGRSRSASASRRSPSSPVRYFAIRPVQAEYLMTKFPDRANSRQSNFRSGAGIVLRLGKKWLFRDAA
jgi:hypothetical protein